jgi:5-methylcytosine-specific restriction enzyme A
MRTMKRRGRVGDTEHRRSLAKLISSHKRRAAQHSQSIDYTAADLLQLAQETTHCPYCGDELKPGKYQYDHIKPLSRKGSASISNMQCLCSRCNKRKSSLDDVEFQMLNKALDDIADAVGDSYVKCKVLKALAMSRF